MIQREHSIKTEFRPCSSQHLTSYITAAACLPQFYCLDLIFKYVLQGTSWASSSSQLLTPITNLATSSSRKHHWIGQVLLYPSAPHTTLHPIHDAARNLGRDIRKCWLLMSHGFWAVWGWSWTECRVMWVIVGYSNPCPIQWYSHTPLHPFHNHPQAAQTPRVFTGTCPFLTPSAWLCARLLPSPSSEGSTARWGLAFSLQFVFLPFGNLGRWVCLDVLGQRTEAW